MIHFSIDFGSVAVKGPAGVAGGGWRVEGGGWRVEGGGWRVEGGGWRVEGGGWRVTKDRKEPRLTASHHTHASVHCSRVGSVTRQQCIRCVRTAL